MVSVVFSSKASKPSGSACRAAKTPSEEGLSVYFNQVAAVSKRLLTADEEIALGDLVQAGRTAQNKLSNPSLTLAEKRSLRSTEREGLEARNRLVESNLRIVVLISKHYGNSTLKPADIIQAGNEGLLEAAARFDGRKARFVAYARYWIHQSIIKLLHDHARMIRVPNYIWEIARVAEQVKKRLVAEGKDPSPDDIYAELSGRYSRVEFERMLKSFHSVCSDASLGEGNAQSSTATGSTDPTFISPESFAWSAFLSDTLEEALEKLEQHSERQAAAVRLRHPLIGGVAPLTFAKIGERFGYTDMWASTQYRKGMQWLKENTDVNLVADLNSD